MPRNAVALTPVLVVALLLDLGSTCPANADTFLTDIPKDRERTWVAPELWANRLQDWRVANGRLECVEGRTTKPMRTVHLVTHRLGSQEGELKMRVRTARVDEEGEVADDAAYGFLIGCGGPNVDHRSASLVHHSPGTGGGIFVGLSGGGDFIIRDNNKRHTARLWSDWTLPRDGWKIVSADSVEKGSPAENILDNDLDTIWHTEWKTKRPKHPHEVVIDMGKSQSISGFAYAPRHDNSAGRVDHYEFFVSEDGKSWGEPLSKGRLDDDGDGIIIHTDKSKRGRYLKFVALSAHNGRPSTTIAELLAVGGFSIGVGGGASTDTKKPEPKILAEPDPEAQPDEVLLDVHVKPVNGRYQISLTMIDGETGQWRGWTRGTFDADRLIGNIALVSHPGRASKNKKTGRYWFRDWSVEGSKLDVDRSRAVGPVISTQHTLSRSVLQLTAQLMPVGATDPKQAALEVLDGDTWKERARADVIVPGWTAPFRVADWDSSRSWKYRVSYDGKHFGGEIRKDPVDKETIVVAGFTGNHMTQSGVERKKFDWSKSVWFPHRDLTMQVEKHEPDVLFFSGDQIYEGGSPTHVDRPEIQLDYLYKWYLWCWAYRDLTRDIPTVTIPDDHDVYQGNLWGESGRKTDKDDKGGYVHPHEFVKMVERTQTSHLPDPFDPTPIEQGIGVYYTGMTYGRISFAVLEDRKFKTGCNGRVPPSGSPRADHITDPDFDVKLADVAGAKLLGDRQLLFLRDWATDWRGADMKIALSQTVFAGMATHHGGNLQYLRADLDSNGWPQTGRNKAVHELRRAFTFHLAGDQHLATIVQHGIDAWNDANWSFAVPSVANFYPRKWYPKTPGANREPGAPEFTGEHTDGFGNRVTVYAASNPGKDMGHEPKSLHNRMPGYGIVKLDKNARTITMECWPRFADPKNPKHSQYEGWPKTVSQASNYGRKAVAWLPPLRFRDVENPVVQIVEDKTGDIVYTLRIDGTKFQPKVFARGTYTVKAGVDAASVVQVAGLRARNVADQPDYWIKLKR